MYEKNGKYFADWREVDGARRRASFATRRTALSYESEQRKRVEQERGLKDRGGALSGSTSPSSPSRDTKRGRRKS